MTGGRRDEKQRWSIKKPSSRLLPHVAQICVAFFVSLEFPHAIPLSKRLQDLMKV